MNNFLIGVLLITSSIISAQNLRELYGITAPGEIHIVDTQNASSSTDYGSHNNTGLERVFGLTHVSSQKMFYGLEYIKADSVNLFSYNTCTGINIIAQVTYNGIPVKHAEALAYNENMDSVYLSFNEGNHDFASDQLGIIDLVTGSINKIGTFSGTGQASENPDMDGMTFINNVLYGIDAGNNKPSHFYKIDHSTAVASTIGIMTRPNVNSLAFDDNGNNLYGYSSNTNELFIIDTTDASTSTIGVSANYTAISFGTKNNKLDGEIFALSDDAVLSINPMNAQSITLNEGLNIGSYFGLAYNGSELFYADRNTNTPILMMVDSCVTLHEIGEITFVPGSNQLAPFGPVEGLSFNNFNQELYISIGDKNSVDFQSEHIGIIDQNTAEVTFLSSITGTLDNEADDISFGENEFFVLDGTGSQTARLYTNQIETGVSQLIGNTYGLGLNSISWDHKAGIMYALNSSNAKLSTVNVNTGSLATIGIISGNHSGIKEIVTVNPGYREHFITGNTTNEETTISIYPNPTSLSFVINSDVVVSNVAITSLSGVTQNNVTLSNNTVDVSNLANGIYFVTFKENEQLISQKISIQK